MTKEMFFKVSPMSVLTHHNSVHIPGCNHSMKCYFDLPKHVQQPPKEKQAPKVWSLFVTRPEHFQTWYTK